MAKAKTQIQKFRDLARTLESDETEGRFNDTLRHVAQHKPVKPAKAATKARKKR